MGNLIKTKYFVSKPIEGRNAKAIIEEIIAERNIFFDEKRDQIAEIIDENIRVSNVNSNTGCAILTLSYFEK